MPLFIASIAQLAVSMAHLINRKKIIMTIGIDLHGLVKRMIILFNDVPNEARTQVSMILLRSL